MPEEDARSSEFYGFTQGLKKILSRLRETHATKEDAWHEVTNFFLEFAGRCSDLELADRAQKICQQILKDIPAREVGKEKKLDSPFAQNMNLDALIDSARKGATISAKEMK